MGMDLARLQIRRHLRLSGDFTGRSRVDGSTYRQILGVKLVGLTGGVGMGKSTACVFLAQLGCRIIDTDEIARELVVPGSVALSEIQVAFGPVVLDQSGALNRGALANVVFTDAVARQKLEQILHPRIRAEWKQRAEDLCVAGEGCAVVAIPLLFETGAEDEFDCIVTVACSGSTQHARLAERGWSPEQIGGRIAAQKTSAEKIARADFMVWTEGAQEVHAAQVQRVFDSVKNL